MKRPDPRRLAAVSTAAMLGLAVAVGVVGCGSSAHQATVTTETLSAPGSAAAPSAAASSAAVTVTGSSASTVNGPSTQTTGTVTTASTATHPLVHLRAMVERYAAALGPHVGILIEDLATGHVLYSQNASVPRAPASVEKLYTSAAMLWTFDPGTVLHTDVLGVGHLAAHGVWVGNLFLRGDGDPTFGDPNWQRANEGGLGSSPQALINQLLRDGIRRVSGRLYADASAFDADLGGPATANQPDIPDYGGELSALVYDHGYTVGALSPEVTAAHLLAVMAAHSGLTVHTAPRPGVTPAGATILASVASPTVAQMLKLMLVPSDDLFADLFAKQLGLRASGHGTLAAGAQAISEMMQAHYNLTPTILDGSGLDKADRSSPEQIVSLLAQLHGTSIGDVIQAGLPVMGQTGTVQDMGLGTPAAGRCVAKTGTLDDVTNLAGYCQAKDGHTLAFAIMADGPGNWAALAPIGKIAGEAAFY